MSLLAASEAVFGSLSRGDGDQLSDKDILIVDDNLSLLRERRDALTSQGWSVAPYTFAKLDALSVKGALFVQHLKLESKILTDRDARLSEILASFTPKSSYQEEIKANNALAQLSDVRVDTDMGQMWAADVLYVAVRNFGILYLAERRRYEFSFAGVLSGLSQEGLITARSVDSLAKLRDIKAMYREGQLIDQSLVKVVLNEVNESLPHSFYNTSPTTVSPAFLISNVIPLQASSSAYHRLRHLERAYLALSSLRPEAAIKNNLQILKRWICNPRAYVSLAVTAEPKLLMEMRREAAKTLCVDTHQPSQRWGLNGGIHSGLRSGAAV